MFPRVIKAGAGPHDLGSGNNHDETFPELTVQLNMDSDTGSDSSGDSTTEYSSSITSCDSGLELFHNVSSVRQFPSPRLSVLTSPFRRKKTPSMLLRNGSSR